MQMYSVGRRLLRLAQWARGWMGRRALEEAFSPPAAAGAGSSAVVDAGGRLSEEVMERVVQAAKQAAEAAAGAAAAAGSAKGAK